MSNFLLFVLLIALFVWARKRLGAMQVRLDELTEQIDRLLATDQSTSAESVVAVPTIEEVPTARIAPPSILITAPTSLSSAHPTEPVVPQAAPTIALPEEPMPSKPAGRPNPLLQWFTRMNIMVQIGIVVLFFGVAFLVKYAADQGWLAIELRLTGAALLGGVLAVIGWRVRERARGYGLALSGGGIGIIYVTTFGAYRLYELIPANLAFAIFVALGILYAAIALLNNAQILAFLALLGGLLAPILAGEGGGSHIVLFSYFLVVNAGILVIAWFKAWRRLNFASFTLTLLAAIGWGTSEYTTSIFTSTEPFLIIFFLFYLTVTVLYARRLLGNSAASHRIAILDLLLLFANPLISFTLQYALVENLEGEATRWMAQSALVMATIYAGLAFWANRSAGWANALQEQRTSRWVVEAFLFLSTFFLAISFPLLYDARITAAIWALQAVGLHWLGVRRQRGWAHFWAGFVRLAATVAFVVDALDPALTGSGSGAANGLFSSLPLFTNHIYIGALILSLSALISAYILRPEQSRRPVLYTLFAVGTLVWGLLWWFGSGMTEIIVHVRPTTYIISSLVAFVALSCVAAELIGGWLRWTALRLTLTVMLPLVGSLALMQLQWEEPVSAGGGWYAWPLLFVAHLFMLWRLPSWPWGQRSWMALYHAGGVWLGTFLLTRLAYGWALNSSDVTTWRMLTWLLVPALLLWFIGILTPRMPWPIGKHRQWYRLVAALPLVIFVVFTILQVSLTLPGASAPLPYLPVLNPLTLALIATVITLWYWLVKVGEESGTTLQEFVWAGKLGLGVIAFIALNAGLARDIHQLTGVAFAWDALYASEVLQTTYAIVWGAISLVLMFWANRRGQRQGGWSAVWFFGAAVLGLTVLKLFFVDLANSDTVARIISFMGVGLLIIVIAYFAPLPTQPKEVEAA